MATASRVGARMSASLGFCVGGGPGCRAGDLWQGFGAFRSARKGLGRSRRRTGRSGASETVAGNSFHGLSLWPLQQRQSRFRDVVAGLQDSWWSSPLGGRTVVKFSGYVSVSRSGPNSAWPLLSHRSEESPRIISSSHQDDGPVDGTDPPPLFMGSQLKRFSHVRDGIIHWCRYLDVREDTRNHGQALVRGEHGSPPGTQIVVKDPMADAIDPNSSDITVICFDIETTGFSATNDRIIEFAARDLAGGECSTIETLVNPQREVRNEHVHHISTRMVNNAGVPKWKDVALALVNFVESRRKGRGLVILVAHNGKRFDVPFIMNEFHACGVSMPSYWRFADSLVLAKLAMKGSGKSPSPKTSLGQLFTYYNLPEEGQAHRAMADVNMLAHVLERLMNDLEMTTEDLLEQSFGADEIVMKGKDSKKEIVISSPVDKERRGIMKLVENVQNSGAGSVPWDLSTVDSAGRGKEDQFETKLGTEFGQALNSSSQLSPNQDHGSSFQMPKLGGLDSGPNKKIMVQRFRQTRAPPLMLNSPRLVRTPAIRPRKVDVQRDITT